MTWGFGGERATERALRDRYLWDPIRKSLASRYSGYPGLLPAAMPPSRSEFRRWREKYGIDARLFELFAGMFERLTADLACELGMFDGVSGSWTHPATWNLLTGDGTHFRARFDAMPGDLQVNSETGELEQKPFDADAAWVTVNTSDGGSATLWGLRFGFVEGWLPHEDERLILSVFNIGPAAGEDEASRAMDALGRLFSLLPGSQGVAWDMALRGTHQDRILTLGRIPIVKTPKASGGQAKSRRIGQHWARRAGRKIGKVDVIAVGGHPALRFVARGNAEVVLLERRQTKRVQRGSAAYVFYSSYEISDDARVPQRLRGARVMIRHNTTDADRSRGLNRTENLKVISQGDPDWSRVYAIRPGSESINSWVKRRLEGTRAPAVGIARTSFALTCAALYNNFRALVAHCRRRAMLVAGAPPGALAA